MEQRAFEPVGLAQFTPGRLKASFTNQCCLWDHRLDQCLDNTQWLPLIICTYINTTKAKQLGPALRWQSLATGIGTNYD